MSGDVKLNKAPYGVRLSLSGTIERADLCLGIANIKYYFTPINILIDCSNIDKINIEASRRLVAMLRLLFKNNINRVVIVYKSNAQIINITKSISKIFGKRERYVSVMFEDEGFFKAEKYLQFGVEP